MPPVTRHLSFNFFLWMKRWWWLVIVSVLGAVEVVTGVLPLYGLVMTRPQEEACYWSRDKQNANTFRIVHPGTLEWRGSAVLDASQPYLYVLVYHGERPVLVGHPVAHGGYGGLYHSCLSGGGPVLAAGTIRHATDGTRIWDNTSGHYRPPPSSLHTLLEWLRAQQPQQPHAASDRLPSESDLFRIWARGDCGWLGSGLCQEHYYQFTTRQLARILPASHWPAALQTILLDLQPYFIHTDQTDPHTSDQTRIVLYIPWPHRTDRS